jgi:DNA-binding XRE family transcriptional regulator
MIFRMTPKELRETRTLLGLTQEQLAAELGVVRFSVQRWEAGVYRIPGMLTLALEALMARRIQFITNPSAETRKTKDLTPRTAVAIPES